MIFITLVLIALPAAFSYPTLWLFTRKNKDVPQQIDQHHLDLLKSSNFNFNAPTWIGIHGWRQAYNISAHENNEISNLQGLDIFFNITIFRDIKNLYLEQGDVNVIGCDWRVLAKGEYVEARFQMVGVAGQLAKFINMLKDDGYDDRKINLVGFSLGAHAAGIAGESVKGGFRGSIIAGDPPAILFNLNDDRGRLSKGDAAYVEVLHLSQLGTTSPLGDVDFYINGGLHQPGCSVTNPFEGILCGHGRTMVAYRDSLKWSMIGKKCQSEYHAFFHWCDGERMQMGGQMPKTWSPGIYNMDT